MFKKITMLTLTFLVLFALFSSPAQAKTIPPQIESEGRGLPVGGMFDIHSTDELYERDPVVAYNSIQKEYMVVWANDRPGNDDIQAQRVSPNGQLIGPAFYVSAGAGAERQLPDIAYDYKNDQYLVVWIQHTEDYGEILGIYGRLISGTGAVQGTSDIIIASVTSGIASVQNPAVDYAYTSDNFMVVWSEHTSTMPYCGDIIGRVVANDGTLPGSQFIISDDTGSGNFRSYPDIAYNRHANRFMVVWNQYDDFASTWDIYAQQVHGGGGLFEAPILIAYYTVDTLYPKIASIPTAPGNVKFLVVWETHYSGVDYDIYMRTIEEDGTALPVQHLAEANGFMEERPKISGNETSHKYLVTWEQIVEDDWYSAGPGKGLVGIEVNYNGSILSTYKKVGMVYCSVASIAAGTAGDFLVVFEQGSAFTWGISGELWGLRNYLPMIIR